MVLKFFLFVLLTSNLFALTLQSTYYIHSRNIKLQDIIPNASYDVTLNQIEGNRFRKKIRSTDIAALLKKHGYKDVETTSAYIQFVKKSPIDTSNIRTKVIELYKKKYPDIKIDSVLVMPRSYLTSLPDQYDIDIHRKAHLSNEGTLSIKTLDKKKIFFNYIVDAKVYVYTSKNTIQRGERISALNTIKKSIQLDKFRASPININKLNISQSKRHLRAGYIITIRDIEELNLVKRGANISVAFQNKNINISFSAKALQNGKLNDIITIEKNDQTRLKAKVIAKNRVEIQ